MSFAFMPKWCAILGLIPFFVGCGKQPAPIEPIRSVKVVRVESIDFNSSSKLPGDVRARVESKLAFRVSGKVIHRSVELGQHVKAGQELARLDDRDFMLSIQNAVAQLEAAKTQRDLALADLKRFEDLRKQQFISEAELDRRSASLKAAQAQFDQVTTLHQLQSNQRSDARLVADASGVVTAIEVEVGQVVSAGQVIVRIAQDGPREIALSAPESQLMNIKPGLEYPVTFHASGETGMAKVREVAASAEPLTRTYEVKLSLQSEKQPPLGATVSVHIRAIRMTSLDTVSVPATALVQKNGESSVWVFDENSSTVRSVPVQVMQLTEDQALIQKGLSAGQWVVSAGPHVLTEGQRVTRYAGKTP